MGTIETLAEFVCAFEYDRIPAKSLAHAEDLVLDAVGCAAAGFGTGGATAVRAVSPGRQGAGGSTAWYTGPGASTIGAAFANAVATQALDIDDGHRAALGHPGAAVIPAALAIAEEVGASGTEFLAAVVLGYDAAIRFAANRNMDTHLSIATGRWAAVGVAAAAGRLRKLSPEAMKHALLVAEQHAPGLLSAHLHGFGGAHVKEGIAWSVVTGLFAVDLAAAGFTGYPDTLDLPVLYDGERVGADLGGTFWIDRTYVKPYSCCRFMHSGLDAILQMIGENGLVADDITGVHVDGFTALVNLDNKLDPPNFEASQFSVPFAIAVAAIEGKAGLAPLKPDLLGRADLVDFAGRVTMSVDSAIDRLYPAQAASRVTVEARQGTFQMYIEDPIGDPANPLGRSGIRDKFRHLAGRHLDADRIETLIGGSSFLADGGLPVLLGALSDPLNTE